MSKEKTVKTVSGKVVNEADALYIKSQDKWYEKGVNIFQVNYTKKGKPQWYRFDHPHLEYDEGKAEYIDNRVVTLMPILKGWTEGWEPIWGKTTVAGHKWNRLECTIVNSDVIAQKVANELKISAKEANGKIFKDPNTNIWYDYTSDNVVEDCNLPGQVVLKTAAEKVVTEVKGTKSFVYGYTKNPEAGVQIASQSYPVKWVSNEKIALEMDLKEDIYDGVYRDKPNGKYGKRRYYEFVHDEEKLAANIEKSLMTLTEGIVDYSFGVEMETSIGYIPPRIMSRFPFKCIRDGSIPEMGAEYISDVLGRDYGFGVLEGFCEEISKRCKVNENCSLHVHIGKVPCTPEFNVAIYSLCEKIQDEVFSMLPYSRIDHAYNENYHIRKNYCRPLRRLFYKPTVSRLINTMEDGGNTSELIELLDDKINEHVLSALDGEREVPPPKGWKEVFNRQTKRHPVNNKYHRAQRYEWLSLCDLTFSEGCHLEIRSHSGTLSYRKISNWIRLMMAVCHYAENKLRESIDPNFIPTLEEIVDYAYPRTGLPLINYINERKEKFNKGVETKEERIKAEQEEYLEK